MTLLACQKGRLSVPVVPSAPLLLYYCSRTVLNSPNLARERAACKLRSSPTGAHSAEKEDTVIVHLPSHAKKSPDPDWTRMSAVQLMGWR